MAPKPAKSRQKFREGRNGGRLKSGGPNKGAGRPPDEFKRRLAVIASSDEILEYIQSCAQGEFGPLAALKAVEFAAERGYGKVPTVMKVEGDEARPLVVKVVKS